MILRENHIGFNREKVIALGDTYQEANIERESFRQVDFAIARLKLFIEVDGPEHIKEADDFREKQILGQPFYKNWRFVRIKSDVAVDIKKCRIALQPIIDEWMKLPIDVRRQYETFNFKSKRNQKTKQIPFRKLKTSLQKGLPYKGE